jgi:hypothetical protein
MVTAAGFLQEFAGLRLDVWENSPLLWLANFF